MCRITRCAITIGLESCFVTEFLFFSTTGDVFDMTVSKIMFSDGFYYGYYPHFEKRDVRWRIICNASSYIDNLDELKDGSVFKLAKCRLSLSPFKKVPTNIEVSGFVPFTLDDKHETSLCMSTAFSNATHCFGFESVATQLHALQLRAFEDIRDFLYNQDVNVITLPKKCFKGTGRETTQHDLLDAVVNKSISWGIGVIWPVSESNSDASRPLAVDFTSQKVYHCFSTHVYDLSKESLDVCVSGDQGCKGVEKIYLFTKRRVATRKRKLSEEFDQRQDAETQT
jgi:hypothetical protein